MSKRSFIRFFDLKGFGHLLSNRRRGYRPIADVSNRPPAPPPPPPTRADLRERRAQDRADQAMATILNSGKDAP